MGQNKNSFIHTLVRLILLFPILFRTINQFLSLIESEAALAKRKIIILFICMILFFSLIFSTWLCLLAMFFVYLISLKLSLVFSLLITFILNILLLIISGLIILNLKNGLLFPKTREILSLLIK